MVTVIGVIGAAVLLVCFILNQLKFLSTDSLWYDGGNLIGAALLAAYAYLIGSLPFLVIEAVWALVSLRDVIHHLKK